MYIIYNRLNDSFDNDTAITKQLMHRTVVSYAIASSYTPCMHAYGKLVESDLCSGGDGPNNSRKRGLVLYTNYSTYNISAHMKEIWLTRLDHYHAYGALS